MSAAFLLVNRDTEISISKAKHIPAPDVFHCVPIV